MSDLISQLEIREAAGGQAFRLYQLQEPTNRYLADVRSVPALPPARWISDILVMAPADLVASKVIGHEGRRGRSKSDAAAVLHIMRTADPEPSAGLCWSA